MQFFKSYFIFFKPQKRQKILNVSKLCKSKKSAMVYFFSFERFVFNTLFCHFFFHAMPQRYSQSAQYFYFSTTKETKDFVFFKFYKSKKEQWITFYSFDELVFNTFFCCFCGLFFFALRKNF